jgi:hypothetical protein
MIIPGAADIEDVAPQGHLALPGDHGHTLVAPGHRPAHDLFRGHLFSPNEVEILPVHHVEGWELEQEIVQREDDPAGPAAVLEREKGLPPPAPFPGHALLPGRKKDPGTLPERQCAFGSEQGKQALHPQQLGLPGDDEHRAPARREEGLGEDGLRTRPAFVDPQGVSQPFENALNFLVQGYLSPQRKKSRPPLIGMTAVPPQNRVHPVPVKGRSCVMSLRAPEKT